jgi:nitrogen regulatory protein PII-like uncharacterized protein
MSIAPNSWKLILRDEPWENMIKLNIKYMYKYVLLGTEVERRELQRVNDLRLQKIRTPHLHSNAYSVGYI